MHISVVLAQAHIIRLPNENICAKEPEWLLQEPTDNDTLAAINEIVSAHLNGTHFCH